MTSSMADTSCRCRASRKSLDRALHEPECLLGVRPVNRDRDGALLGGHLQRLVEATNEGVGGVAFGESVNRNAQ